VLRSTAGRPSPMANSPIDAGIDDFSHPLGVHRLFNRPALNHVLAESPFGARECGVDYQGALQGRTAQQKDIRCTNTECKNFGKIFYPTPWRSSGAQS
jgi:hypothetical protein